MPREKPEFSMKRTLLLGGGMLLLFGWMLMRDPPRRPHAYLTGTCMGPISYRVKIVGANLTDLEARRLNFKVKNGVLEKVNRLMSTYQAESEVSRFNKGGTEAFEVSPEFREVLDFSLKTHAETDGAFDPTVAAVVDYWGFGPTKLRGATNQFAVAMAAMGAGEIGLAEARVTKARAEIQLDFNAVAKGYAVDEVDRFLVARGFTNTMIEVGGEVFARGTGTNATPWKLAVQHPEVGASNYWAVVELRDAALATSGTYYQRNRDEAGGVTSHIIDPRTARPTTNGVVSVSVIAPTCMEADALATALLVMGPATGIPWVESRSGAEVLFVLDRVGRLEEVRSAGWPGGR